ncbi:hypothetical protein EGW08_003387 [Elysia chlorotica]|uniref:Uncharacterized protein n=1 Tax=Elysia chlorotica TaxID=188477 RepID=A0A433U4V0_ELYCH|nr:hypothetical protein EGW08_003387 [Elysia chlorotica]
MEFLLQNPIFRARMKSLTPATRRWFIESLIDLFDQESEYVIDVIEDCRQEMRDTADSYRGDAEELRAKSRMLHERRMSPSPDRSVSRQSTSVSSRLSFAPDRQGTQDSLLTTRRGHRRRRILNSDGDGYIPSPTPRPGDGSGANQRCASSLSVPSLPALVSSVRGPSPSARTTRSLPVTPSVPTEEEQLQQKRRMHDESRAILHSMNMRESQAEKERERQQERLERLRRQKRSLMEDRTQQALKLLEKALEMDKVLAQDKERQELQLRSKLDEMKRRKGEKKDAEFVEIIDLKEK